MFTSKPDAEAGPGVLPISYSGLPTMAEKGDTIFLGRYLVTGSEDSSVYLTVSLAPAWQMPPPPPPPAPSGGKWYGLACQGSSFTSCLARQNLPSSLQEMGLPRSSR